MVRTPLRPRRIDGYAIVSEDGMLTNAAGIMPDSLKFEADRDFFERGLDEVDVVFPEPISVWLTRTNWLPRDLLARRTYADPR